MKKDISALTQEELLEYVKSLEEDNDSLRNDLKTASKKIDKLEIDFAELQEEYNKLLKKFEAKTQIIKLNNHNNFYSKKESTNEDILLNEAEHEIKKAGRKTGSKNFDSIDFESLVTNTIIENPGQLICEDCGSELVKIGEDISYKVNKIPTKIEVTKIIRPLYKCPQCDGKIFQALCDSNFPHSVCTPSLAANIIDAKFNLGVPFYRYSKYLKNNNIALSTMDLCNYFMRSDEILKPLYNEILNRLVNTQSNVIFSDETPIKVLNLNKNNRKTSYIFVYISSFYDYPIYIYAFNENRKTDELAGLTHEFNGYLVCDGYPGYDKLRENNPNIKIQRCFAHIRRNFFDVIKVLPEEKKKTSKAYEMVKRIDRLFFLENQAKLKHLDPDSIKEFRNSDEYLNDFNSIYSFLHSLNPEAGTPLKKAVDYFLKFESDSKTFLQDGHIPISNNIAERAVKPFVICRKNFLFSKSVNGAEASGRLFSILQTAKANGLVPEMYLAYCLENMNKVTVEDLLPWSEKLPDSLKVSIK